MKNEKNTGSYKEEKYRVKDTTQWKLEQQQTYKTYKKTISQKGSKRVKLSSRKEQLFYI